MDKSIILWHNVFTLLSAWLGPLNTHAIIFILN